MTMVQWPSDLPGIQLKGYASGPSDGRTITQMDRGPAKVRGSASGGKQSAAVEMMVDTAQHARFQRFWNEETRGGADWFLIPDQINDGAVIEGLADNEGNETTGTSYWIARFAQAPQATASPGEANLYRITMTLDVVQPS